MPRRANCTFEISRKTHAESLDLLDASVALARRARRDACPPAKAGAPQMVGLRIRR